MEIRKWRVRTDQIFRTVESSDKKNRFRELIVPMRSQRGGITRSNGKCSKKVAIMDKDLNGNWSNGKCPNWK